jgi:predicted amidohydrolase YtcJ
MKVKSLLGVAFALVLCTGAPAAEKADLILIHGRIITMDAQDRVVQAIAVTGGRIIATGSDKRIMALATSGTQVIDLGGRAATPGLIDAHAHLSGENAAPDRSVEQIESDILRDFEALHGQGITAVRDPHVTASGWEAYRAVLTADGLTERVCVLLSPGTQPEAAPKSLGDGRLISCGTGTVAGDTDTPRPINWTSVQRDIAKERRGAASVHDVLRSYTRLAAPLLHIEGEAGSLEKGKRADLAVWDRDPYKVRQDQLADMKCLMTLLDGEVIYRTEQAPLVSKR